MYITRQRMPQSLAGVATVANSTQRRIRMVYMIASPVSMALSAYHGYKRNDSVGWAVTWGLLGGLFPIVTPVIALAQGYAKPA